MATTQQRRDRLTILRKCDNLVASALTIKELVAQGRYEDVLTAFDEFDKERRWIGSLAALLNYPEDNYSSEGARDPDPEDTGDDKE